MIQRCLAVLCLGVFLLVVGQSPGDEATDKELKQLEGNWLATGGEQNGKPTDRFDDSRVTIAGNNFTVVKEGKELFKATLKLDPSKKPKAVDLNFVEGEAKGETALGIYVLSGDDLKLCFDKPGAKTRPTAFATKKGSELMIVNLKREKK